MGNLTGKYAVVTGGANGIGAAVAKRFLKDDIAGVAIFDYNHEDAVSTAKGLDPAGKKVLTFKCDVSAKDQVEAAVNGTMAEFGTVDILVNNAGTVTRGMFHKYTDDQWNRVLGVNLTGLYYVTRMILPAMRNQNSGRIINIASTSAFGELGQAVYSATKAGIIGLTKTLAKENGSKNVLVNAVAPGFIITKMFTEERVRASAELTGRLLLGRMGTADELASAVAFFAGPDSSYITGQCLVVSGGTVM